jgi:hypothetical protein
MRLVTSESWEPCILRASASASAGHVWELSRCMTLCKNHPQHSTYLRGESLPLTSSGCSTRSGTDSVAEVVAGSGSEWLSSAWDGAACWPCSKSARVALSFRVNQTRGVTSNL